MLRPRGPHTAQQTQRYLQENMSRSNVDVLCIIRRINPLHRGVPVGLINNLLGSKTGSWQGLIGAKLMCMREYLHYKIKKCALHI